ncbi:MAG: HAD family phosphatase [Verrucomicrobiota bacterium]|nr:HAD family phosphatase [Verrucomicrobiota bacterium]
MPVDSPSFAVIFDLDGVIVDSSRFHEESWDILATETGWTLPEGFFKKTFGMRNMNIIPLYLEPGAEESRVAALSRRKEEIFRELARGKVTLLPGVKKLAESLARDNVPMAVGSSTELENIRLVLDSTQIAPCFRAIVSSEDVTQGKPAPDCFLMAAGKLMCTPANCVVIEDAQVGIDAARAAGMACLALATTHPGHTLSRYSRLAPNLEEITPEDLRELVIQKPLS